MAGRPPPPTLVSNGARSFVAQETIQAPAPRAPARLDLIIGDDGVRDLRGQPLVPPSRPQALPASPPPQPAKAEGRQPPHAVSAAHQGMTMEEYRRFLQGAVNQMSDQELLQWWLPGRLLVKR